MDIKGVVQRGPNTYRFTVSNYDFQGARRHTAHKSGKTCYASVYRIC